MMSWLDALAMLNQPSVLVTVAAVEGSAPRAPGTKMVFTEEAQFDTIGGGHLELRASELARAMLSKPAAKRQLIRIPLGPGLGQCCGGVVHLFFEYVGAQDRSCYLQLVQRQRNRADCWRIVPLDDDTPMSLLDRNHECIAGPVPSVSMQDSEHTHVVQGQGPERWLVDPCLAYRPHLVLFGAGHVGAAIVRALADLPCHVTWVDEREDIFPDTIPSNVTVEITDIPEAIVNEAPADSCFLVMTHSHAVDQRLCEAILRRQQIGWFGLIGSKTKRRQFEHRLLERGIPADQLNQMICPIGLPGIRGKEPAVIAISVAAQLLQVWETDAHPPAAASSELRSLSSPLPV